MKKLDMKKITNACKIIVCVSAVVCLVGAIMSRNWFAVALNVCTLKAIS